MRPAFAAARPRSFSDVVNDHPWLWVFAAVLIEWVVLAVVADRGFLGSMKAQLTLVPFLVIVSVGQMFVITLGAGNIDLSIPYTIPLAAYVSFGITGSSAGSLTLGILAGLLCGAIVGFLNALGILLLRIPPIVCTLAVGFLVQTATYVRASNMNKAAPQSLVSFTLLTWGGIPITTWACLGLSIIAAVVLHRTPYGRTVQAIGQNRIAADLAGLTVARTVLYTYVLSGVLAGLSGVFLGAFSGLSLDLGSTYLLTSVASVVVGGSLVAGGRSFVTGVWGGAIFLGLSVTLLAVIGASSAVQDIGEGGLILLVLLFAGRAGGLRSE